MNDGIEYDLNGGCWLFARSQDHAGYGLVSIGGKNVKAHRVAWAVHRGPIPEGLKVCHRCDVRCCVNPDHLFLGTQADNVADMVAKGRHRNVPRFGHDNPMAVLREDDVWAIRHMLRLRLFSQNEIARSYGVAPMTISRIANRQTWPHVHMNWPFDPQPETSRAA